MENYDQICNHCKDVIFDRTDAVRIQNGFFNQFKEFVSIPPDYVLHKKCHDEIQAMALVMKKVIDAPPCID